MRPTVSLIVTTYNIEPYIWKCINSLRDQTFKDFELIVVDDGSTDGTLLELERAIRYGLRNRTVIPLPENTPGGVGTAANIGVSVAKGTYIAFADGDDWYEPTMIESLVSRAKAADADIVIADYRNFDEAAQEVQLPGDRKRFTALAHEEVREGECRLTEQFRRDLLRLNAVPWRKLYKSEFLHRNGIVFPEGNYFFEDNPYHWQCVLQAGRVTFLDEVICYHRMNRPGQTMASAGRELLAFFEHYRTIDKWTKDRAFDQAYGDSVLGWILGQTEWISKRIDPSCWGALYECLISITQDKTYQNMVDALHERQLGQYGWRVALNAYSQNAVGFFEALRFPATYSDRLGTIETSVKALEKSVKASVKALDVAVQNLRATEAARRRTDEQEAALRMLSTFNKKRSTRAVDSGNDKAVPRGLETPASTPGETTMLHSDPTSSADVKVRHLESVDGATHRASVPE